MGRLFRKGSFRSSLSTPIQISRMGEVVTINVMQLRLDDWLAD